MSAASIDDRVHTLREAAKLCGISYNTLRRRVADGTGPKITQLSTRRFGVRESHRLAWLDSRVTSLAA